MLCIISFVPVFPQEAAWNLGVNSFFDNVEFGGSSVKIPQTMSGIIVSPGIHTVWDSIHHVNIGVDLLHEFGSIKPVDRTFLTAFYELKAGYFNFKMGAIPRSLANGKYPRIFFQDSIAYYRPNINGISLGYRHKNFSGALWLDWTGRQTATVNEAFFIGFSGRYDIRSFYLQNYSTLFHFASRMNPYFEEPLHDNALFLTSLGYHFYDIPVLTLLDINAGLLSGIERSRGDNSGWILLNNIMIETRAEYRSLGLFNTFCSGSGLMHFYNSHGNDLYWGDPAYRAKIYNRSDFYIRFISNKIIDLELTWSLHLLENTVYHEQMLKLKIDIEGQNIF